MLSRSLGQKGIRVEMRDALILLVPGAGIEPARGRAPRDFKSLASTCSATQAVEEGEVFDCNNEENY